MLMCRMSRPMCMSSSDSGDCTEDRDVMAMRVHCGFPLIESASTQAKCYCLIVVLFLMPKRAWSQNWARTPSGRGGQSSIVRNLPACC